MHELNRVDIQPGQIIQFPDNCIERSLLAAIILSEIIDHQFVDEQIFCRKTIA
jgi:hypothetical protein